MTIGSNDKAVRERIAKVLTEAADQMVNRVVPGTVPAATGKRLLDRLRRGMQHATSVLTVDEVADLSAMSDEAIVEDLMGDLEPQLRRELAKDLPS